MTPTHTLAHVLLQLNSIIRLSKVNCERSESFNPDDRLRIFECVHKTVGFAALDRTVFKVQPRDALHRVQCAYAACLRFSSAGYCMSCSSSSPPAASRSRPPNCSGHAGAFFTTLGTTTTQRSTWTSACARCVHCSPQSTATPSPHPACLLRLSGEVRLTHRLFRQKPGPFQRFNIGCRRQVFHRPPNVGHPRLGGTLSSMHIASFRIST